MQIWCLIERVWSSLKAALTASLKASLDINFRDLLEREETAGTTEPTQASIQVIKLFIGEDRSSVETSENNY